MRRGGPGRGRGGEGAPGFASRSIGLIAITTGRSSSMIERAGSRWLGIRRSKGLRMTHAAVMISPVPERTMILLPTLLMALSLGVVSAQQATPTHHAPPPGGSDEPVELPVAPVHAPPPELALEQVRVPPVEQIMAFRQRHLDLRVAAGFAGSTTHFRGSLSWGWWPYHGWGWWPSFAVGVSPAGYPDWAVYQGPRRLDVPSYLEIVGDPLRLAALDSDLRRTDLTRKVGLGTSAAGLAAMAVSLVGMDGARTQQDFRSWSSLGTGGVLTAVVGVMVYSSAANRSRRLEADYSYTVEHAETQAQVDAYNEGLRLELGLSEAEANRVLREPRRPGAR
jgi:hypothetical protein